VSDDLGRLGCFMFGAVLPALDLFGGRNGYLFGELYLGNSMESITARIQTGEADLCKDGQANCSNLHGCQTRANYSLVI